MDPKHKMLLQQHQKDIVRDLDVAYIMDELYTCEALTQDDFDHIVDLVRLKIGPFCSDSSLTVLIFGNLFKLYLVCLL